MGGYVVGVPLQGILPGPDHKRVQQHMVRPVHRLAVRYGAVLGRVLPGMSGVAGVQHVYQNDGG